jgi:hypothetical protein
MPVIPSINKEEFRRAFMIQANVIFEEQQRLNKLTVLKDENYREIISILESWGDGQRKILPIHFKWKKK